MTCYRIYLLCPIQALLNQNILNDKCLKLLSRQNNGYLRSTKEINGSILHILDFCDKDASEFLWQLPYPFTVLFITYRDSEILLFSHRIFQKKIVCSSRNLYDKAAYWSAKSLEKHLGLSKLEEEAFF
jgi:hypothetical protein